MNKAIQIEIDTTLSDARSAFDHWVALQKQSVFFETAHEKARHTDNNLVPIWGAPKWSLKYIIPLPPKRANIFLNFESVGERHVGGGQVYSGHWYDLLAALFVAELNKKPLDACKEGSLRTLERQIRTLLDQCQAEGLTHISELQLHHVSSWILELEPTQANKIKNILLQLTKLGFVPLFGDVGDLRLPKRKKAKTQSITPDSVRPISSEELIAFGKVFYTLKDTKNNPHIDNPHFDRLRFYAMTTMLFAATPSREIEAWLQTSDLAVSDNPLTLLQEGEASSDTDDYFFGVRWFPAKNGPPVIRPIPSKMAPLAAHAINVLMEYTQPARDLAAALKAQPGRIPCMAEYPFIEECRVSGRISPEQMRILLGDLGTQPLSSSLKGQRFKQTHKTATLVTENNDVIPFKGKNIGGWINHGGFTNPSVTLCFATFEQEWWRFFLSDWRTKTGHDWPIYSSNYERTIEADDALMIVRYGTLSSQEHISPIQLAVPDIVALSDLLNKVKGSNKKTYWEHFNITLPNGQIPEIETHSFRRYLNTVMQSNQMSNILIALLSGRKDISQNVVYDYRTSHQLLEEGNFVKAFMQHEKIGIDELNIEDIEMIVGDKNKALLIERSVPTIVEDTDQEMTAYQDAVNHTMRSSIVSLTSIGYCLGDLSTSPCAFAQSSCAACNRCVVQVGNEVAQDRLNRQIGLQTKNVSNLKKINRKRKSPMIQEHIDAQSKLIETNKALLSDWKNTIGEAGMPIQLKDTRYGRIDGFSAFANRKAIAAEKKEIANG